MHDYTASIIEHVQNTSGNMFLCTAPKYIINALGTALSRKWSLFSFINIKYYYHLFLVIVSIR